MAVQLIEINYRSSADLARFIDFPFQLYKNHPYWVPPLIQDEYDLFSPKHNPVLKHCELKLLLASKDGRITGRIAGIINQRENSLYQKSKARFGWFDLIDDKETSHALLNAILDWAAAHSMKELEGPMSFTNLDKAGLLVEGFDEMPTLATTYNYPYYAEHIEKAGFIKAVDWIEHELDSPQVIPEKINKYASLIAERYQLKNISIRSKADIKKYAIKVFELINKTHKDLHGFVAFEPEQVNLFVRKYSRILKPEFVSIVVTEQNELIAFGVAMPSVSKALQKAKGKLWPFGWYYLWQALRKNDRLDLYLIGIDPAWRNKGVHSIVFYNNTMSAIKFGIQKVESNPELETNIQVQLLWKGYTYRQHKRRRTYKKEW